MRLAGLTLLLVLALAPAASAHAMLESSEPERGAALDAAPGIVSFRFSEPVEGAFGAVRVFDAAARRVDEGAVLRPGGDRTIGVKLRPGLPDGTYVATFRIVSADSHPVSGGIVFTVGEAGAAAAPAVADLVGGGTGPVTETAFGIARGMTYLATALLVGGLVFLLAVWRTAALGPAAPRARRLAAGAAAAGVVAGLAGLVLQGATASGTTFWSALDADVVREVLDTRFGHVWAVRIAVFAVLGAAATAAVRDAGGTAGRARIALAAGCLGAGFLLLAPSLGGHAAASHPSWALVPLDVVHVAAMSVWVGGLATLLLVVPAATRALEPPGRSRLLARLLLRFSPLALACVLALIGSGMLQSILHIERLGALLDTPFGRAALVKVVLLGALIALGAVQRRRIVPALKRIAGAGEAPGGAGRLLRTVLRTEVLVTVAVLGVTSALVAYPPPDSLATGPYSTTKAIGTRTLEATVEPARVGRNELHVYLLDAKTGAPYDGTEELTVTAALPAKKIGPLRADPTKAGPGHYVVTGLDLVPAGTWQVEVVSRVSEFEESRTTLKVPIR